ncbi:AMP-binding enzyme [Dictyocaulus viviparus]|uniref:AMP-binding enzyme n=1 Tax=Dictyocaulus viviparus TaxID=29172 RepID=A0A0D8XAZ8_DICVI|nr:AMP-binding enzyme [Dictyocaulus viviparus]
MSFQQTNDALAQQQYHIGNMIIFCFFVLAIPPIYASVSLNEYWNDDDTVRLSKVLEGVLRTKKDNIASLHYATSGIKLLNVAPSAPLASTVCEIAKKADLNILEALYHASAIAGDLPDCTLSDIAVAQNTIEKVLKESHLSGERITQALRSADRLGIKVDKAAFDKLLTAAMKDGSPSNLAWIFNAAALLDKSTATKYFNKIKYLVSQADEVDGRYLQFDGGLLTTANAVHGIMSLAEQQGKVPSITKPIKITICNVFGLPVDISGVRVDITPSEANTPVVSNLKLIPVERSSKLYMISSDKIPQAVGFYDVAVKIDSKDNRLVGLTGSSVVFKLSDDVKVDDLRVGVLEKDDVVTGMSTASVAPFSKLGKILTADHTKRLFVSFSVKWKSNGDMVQPNQAFILFKHTDGSEVFYTADLQNDGKYVIDVNLNKAHKDFEGLSGKYTAYLIIGDPLIKTPMNWPFADFMLAVPPAPVRVIPKSQQVIYNALPEIKHVFRQPEKRPAVVVSDTFTVICLSPLLLLIILWYRIGINFGNIPVSLWTLFFHGGLTALFALYFVFWLRLNMFETLKYLAVIGAFTYLSGNRVLRAVAHKRNIANSDAGVKEIIRSVEFTAIVSLAPWGLCKRRNESSHGVLTKPHVYAASVESGYTTMSLTKNLISLTSVGPRPIITWDKAERIRRHEEIWANPNSVVHRLPEHYCKRYWDNLLREATPVHYRPPASRLYWDPKRMVEVEAENYPLYVIFPPEADDGLWGGEGVVKGWKESRPFTKKKVLPRHWVPHLYFPTLKTSVLYSEILDRHMKIVVTERALRLIDQHFGLDYYILRTPLIDLASKLGNRLKREMLLTLAKGEYYANDKERHNYIKNKYAEFVIPVEEADWIGLDLNEASRKQQEIEDRQVVEPLKFNFKTDDVVGDMKENWCLDYVLERTSLQTKNTHQNQRRFMFLRRFVLVIRTSIRQIASADQNILYRAGLENDPKQKGDRVLCRTSKTLDAVALYMACLQIGAIYIPVNISYTRRETEHYVEDSTPKLMVTCNEAEDSVFHPKIINIVSESKLSAESNRCKAQLEIEIVENNDVACICYTSGTTGLPKGVMLTHNSLSTNAEALVDAWRFTKYDKQLHMLPFYHVHGMFISLNCSLFSHSTVIFKEKFSVDSCLKWLPSTTVMMGVPTYYSRLSSSPNFNRKLLPHLRLFVCGSAPLSTPLWEEFKSRTGHAILERYGMTEAQVICSNPYDDRRPGLVGKPIAGTELRINKEGGIEIRSSSLFAGYWNNPEKTADDFTSDKYFVTGDVGSVDEDGYLRILGRTKDLVITGGFNVYPKEIEDCIDRLPGVEESAIIGVPHSDLGEAVVAVVGGKIPTNDKIKEQEIIAALKNVLVSYKIL